MNQQTDNTAVAELAGIEIKGMTRQDFLVRGMFATGAVYGATMIGPFVRSAFAAEEMDDIGILNFALTLEYLEAEFYKRGIANAKLSGEALGVAKEIGANEAEHVQALIGTIKQLGGTPVKAPTVVFPFKDQASFLKLAQVLEDTGVSAYNGAAPAIKSKEVLGAAGSIVQIEARHAARIRLLNGEPPAPVSFDASMTTDEVLMAVKPFVKA